MTAASPLKFAPHLDRTVFAHRGLPSAAPENTMSSFRLACERGATWMETDVDIIADGTAIIIHDSTLDRTTNRSGSFYPLISEELERVDAGSWYSPAFAGEHLPTLREYVDFLNAHRVNANIEIKQNEQGADRTVELVDTVAAELSKLDADREVIISSFSQPLLMKFHERHPEFAIGVLYETVALYDDWLSVLELCGASYIHPEDVRLTKDRVRRFCDAGYGVNVWTVDSVDRANELFNWGCTGVFTNRADSMIHL